VTARLPLIGLGAGGHARVVLDVIDSQSCYEVIGLLDSDRAKWGTKVRGALVLGGDDLLSELRGHGTHHGFVGLGGAGDTSRRRSLYLLLKAQGFTVPTLVHHR
jgi:UDP-perosamine 4-acetyltransferase